LIGALTPELERDAVVDGITLSAALRDAGLADTARSPDAGRYVGASRRASSRDRRWRTRQAHRRRRRHRRAARHAFRPGAAENAGTMMMARRRDGDRAVRACLPDQ
jgi:hypothetical protein